jgi:hypothetical protein
MFKKLFTKAEKETTEKKVTPIETLNDNEVTQIIGGTSTSDRGATNNDSNSLAHETSHTIQQGGGKV